MPVVRADFVVPEDPRSGPVGVAVVATNPVVRAGLTSLVGAEPGARVVATIAATVDLAPALMATEAELVLVDAGLPAAVYELTRQRAGSLVPPVAIAVLVAGEMPPAELAAYVRAGVDGIVTAEDLGDGLAAINSGRAASGWVSPTLAATLLRALPTSSLPSPAPSSPSSTTASPVREEAGAASESVAGTVTPTERAVLQLLADGHTDRAIASRLRRSERAVKYHVSNLLAKLHARNRAHVVRLAVQAGLLVGGCSFGQCPFGQ